MVKPAFILFWLFWAIFQGNGYAQELPSKVIPSAVIESNKDFFTDDQTSRSFNPKPLEAASFQSIGSILEKNSAVSIRNYGGAGSLASISIHGTGSNHTQVSWNGIPLNSPTTGQADLSLIPTSFIQHVEVINGASGSLFGSGTFGGSVNLTSEPDWNNKLSLIYNAGIGSYGNLGNRVTIITGNEKIQYQLTATTSKSANNFSYRDHYRYEVPKVKNSHNAYRDMGIMQNVYLNIGNGHSFDAGIWLQKKELELPALMGSLRQSNAKQKDSLFRTYIAYTKRSEKAVFTIKSAWFSDFLSYVDKPNISDTTYSVNSKIKTNRFINDANLRYYLSSTFIAGVGVSCNLQTGISNNYGGKIHDNEMAAYSSLKYVRKNFIANAGLRKEFYQGLNAPVQYSIGIRYKVKDDFVFMSSWSSKFRKPTFNEKFWKPGGNPDLRPEQGRGGEIAFEWIGMADRTNPFWMKTSISLFHQTIDNWIQWVLRDSLTPVEYKKVQSLGVETWVEYGFNAGHLIITGRTFYGFNKAEIINTFDRNEYYAGNQLIYTPRQTFRTFLDASFNGYMAGFSVSYAGERETVETADPSYRLPAYMLVDFSTGIQKKFGNTSISLFLHIENLFDKEVEIIRAYPSPGRTCHLSLSVGLNKSRSEN